jgi:hypothetical protein
MTTIFVANSVPEATVAKIKSHLRSVALRDPNWGGVVFRVRRGEHTYIANNSLSAVSLFYEIINIIQGVEDDDVDD